MKHLSFVLRIATIDNLFTAFSSNRFNEQPFGRNKRTPLIPPNGPKITAKTRTQNFSVIPFSEISISTWFLFTIWIHIFVRERKTVSNFPKIFCHFEHMRNQISLAWVSGPIYRSRQVRTPYPEKKASSWKLIGEMHSNTTQNKSTKCVNQRQSLCVQLCMCVFVEWIFNFKNSLQNSIDVCKRITNANDPIWLERVQPKVPRSSTCRFLLKWVAAQSVCVCVWLLIS